MMRSWFVWGIILASSRAAIAEDEIGADHRGLQYRIEFKILETEGKLLRPGAVVDLRKISEMEAPGSLLPVLPANRGLTAAQPLVSAAADAAPARLPPPATVPPPPVGPPVPVPPPAAADAAQIDENADLWDIHATSGVRVLASPTVVLLAGQPAKVMIGGTQRFTYLDPLGDNRFVAKRTEPKKLGMEFEVLAEPVEGDAKVVACKLEFQTSALVGREPVEGLDLDVGKPIVSTWSLKTTATMKLGATRTIVLPSGPGQEAALLLRVTRAEDHPDFVPPAK